MVRHSNDSFLNELARLFAQANQAQAGSVQITWKPYSPHADAAARAARPSSSSSSKKKPSHKQSKKQPNPDAMSDVEDGASSHGAPPSIDEVNPSDEPVCLLHARLKDTKISTLITAAHRARFQRAFSALLTVQTAEQLLSKGEKRKVDEVGTAESGKKKKKEKKAAKSDKKPAEGGDVEMSDASATPASAPQPQLTRKERLAQAAAKKKPRISKQQRRELRRQPNPNKDMEKKKEGAPAAAASGSAKKASTKGKK